MKEQSPKFCICHKSVSNNVSGTTSHLQKCLQASRYQNKRSFVHKAWPRSTKLCACRSVSRPNSPGKLPPRSRGKECSVVRSPDIEGSVNSHNQKVHGQFGQLWPRDEHGKKRHQRFIEDKNKISKSCCDMRSKERIRSGNCGRWLHLEKCGRRSTFFLPRCEQTESINLQCQRSGTQPVAKLPQGSFSACQP